MRTRGVFTHRDVFQKPACAERGLVRTAMERGETKRQKPERRKATTTGMEGSRERPRDGAEGREGKKRGQGAKKPQKSAPIWLKEHKLPL